MPGQELSYIETGRTDAAPLTEETNAAFHESDLPYTLDEVRKARLAAAGLFEAVQAPEKLTIPQEILSYGTRGCMMRHDAAHGIPAPEKPAQDWGRFGLTA